MIESEAARLRREVEYLSRRAKVAERRAEYVRYLLTVDAVGAGVCYGFGPDSWHSSPAFGPLLQIFSAVGINWVFFGSVLAGAGLLMLANRTLAVGNTICAFLFLILALCYMKSIVDGNVTGIGGVWHTVVVAGFHVVMLGSRVASEQIRKLERS